MMSNAVRFGLGKGSKGCTLIENAALALWLVVVIGSMLTHELWRDEVRSLSMVAETDSLAEFISIAKYDGHPVVWRLVLTLFYSLFPHPVVVWRSRVW